MRKRTIFGIFLILTLSLSSAFFAPVLGQESTTDTGTVVAAPAVPSPIERLFTARLNGASEVPVNASAGTGYGRVVLNAAENSITASFYWNNLGSGTVAGHIHGPAAPGVNAPILFNMTLTTGLTNGSREDQTFPVTPTDVANLRAGLFYFNIHTTNFGGGEIRGQILANRPHDDFDVDARSDYGIERNVGGSNGQKVFSIRFNDGTNTERSWGLNGDVSAIGDYDGDGKADYAVFRQSNGIFYIIKSSDNTVQTIRFGQSGDKILIADYTADGKDDVAITRTSLNSGTPIQFWYFASSGPFAGRQVEVDWGITGDTPVSGDYNGDGKADFTVERGVSGQAVFFTRLGSDGAASPGPDRQTAFGLSTDTFVPGDYDGDGKTDIAVTRNQANQFVWYYIPSTTGGPYQQQAWGTPSTDVQVQGDYDGDGRTDFAVWRQPASGPAAFYVLGTSSGSIYVPWGNSLTDAALAVDNTF